MAVQCCIDLCRVVKSCLGLIKVVYCYLGIYGVMYILRTLHLTICEVPNQTGRTGLEQVQGNIDFRSSVLILCEEKCILSSSSKVVFC